MSPVCIVLILVFSSVMVADSDVRVFKNVSSWTRGVRPSETRLELPHLLLHGHELDFRGRLQPSMHNSIFNPISGFRSRMSTTLRSVSRLESACGTHRLATEQLPMFFRTT